jgi:hypothetical protein
MTGSPLSGAVLIVCFLLSPATMTLDAVAAAQDASGTQADSVVTAASSSPAASGRDAPLNIQVSPVLARVFEEILAASPTFADQCERIGAAKYVHVRVMPVMAGSTATRGTARTTMRRFSSRSAGVRHDPGSVTTAGRVESSPRVTHIEGSISISRP